MPSSCLTLFLAIPSIPYKQISPPSVFRAPTHCTRDSYLPVVSADIPSRLRGRDQLRGQPERDALLLRYLHHRLGPRQRQHARETSGEGGVRVGRGVEHPEARRKGARLDWGVGVKRELGEYEEKC